MKTIFVMNRVLLVISIPVWAWLAARQLELGLPIAGFWFALAMFALSVLSLTVMALSGGSASGMALIDRPSLGAGYCESRK